MFCDEEIKSRQNILFYIVKLLFQKQVKINFKFMIISMNVSTVDHFGSMFSSLSPCTFLFYIFPHYASVKQTGLAVTP